MSLTGLAIMIFSVSGVADAQDQASVPVTMWAIQATTEGRAQKKIDPGLKAIKETIVTLPYDTFGLLRTEKRKLASKKNHLFKVNELYTLTVVPLARTEDGRIQLDLRVDMLSEKKGDKPVKALASRVKVKPDEKIKLGAFKLKKGKLVIVLTAGNK